MERQRTRGQRDFLEKVVCMLREEGFVGRQQQQQQQDQVVRFKHPLELQDALQLDLGESVENDEELLSMARDIVRYAVRTGHPHFHNQLFGAADPYGVAGAFITEALNTSQYTFEVAPSFTLAEQKVLDRVLDLFGFREGDGIFTPGGSMANMYGMAAARYKMFPEAKTEGVRALPPLAVLTSDDSHYSLSKGAHWLGLGTASVIKVPTDNSGRMMPLELRNFLTQTIADGRRPFMVNATVGTTVLGAIDNLSDIADICEEFGVWMHVDACWGGSLLFSSTYRSRLQGIERANSISWNPHKMLGAPLQCSVFLIREKGLLHRCNSASADYLFQQDKFYDVSWDSGDKSVQCGRKVDAFKLWLLWKARGDHGLELLVNNAMDCAIYFQKHIRSFEGFELVSEELDCPNICFWYIPKSMRDQIRDQKWWNKLSTVAPTIKERLVLAGSLLIGYCPLQHKNQVNFFRMVVTCHPPATYADMDYALKQIDLHGQDL